MTNKVNIDTLKALLLAIFLFFNCYVSHAQDHKTNYSGKSGFGYFTDIYGLFGNVGAQPGSEPGQPGYMLWIEYHVHLSKKNAIGFFAGSGHSSFTRYFDEPFLPSRVTENYWQLNLNFYRYCYFKQSIFSFGIGPSFFTMKRPGISYKTQIIKEDVNYYYIYSDVAIEMDKDAVLGLNLDFNYDYCVNGFLGIGIKINGLATMFYGVESLLLTPYLRLSF